MMKTSNMNLKCILLFFLLHAAKLINSTDIEGGVESSVEIEESFVPYSGSGSPHDGSPVSERKKFDYYEYRHVVANGVQKALFECREKFKWDRWNCPKQAFVDILRRQPLPSNKELGLTRAFIASGIVLSLTRQCSYGANNPFCGCNAQVTVPGDHVGDKLEGISPERHQNDLDTLTPSTINRADQIRNIEHSTQSALVLNNTVNDPKSSNFVWNGCDESIKFAFRVSKTYLDAQDLDNQDEASRRINAHNYEVGRLAIKNKLQKQCKCHGVSGSCQVQTCWPKLPDMGIVAEYLKRKFRLAAKVGATAAVESNIVSLNKELSAMSKDKMVFVDASPDYCYENASLGINGTLGRYCSRSKLQANGTEVSRYERESCDRLCTECGYRAKRETIKYEKQCQCRFVYCCQVQCKRCPVTEEVYKCVRHS